MWSGSRKEAHVTEAREVPAARSAGFDRGHLIQSHARVYINGGFKVRTDKMGFMF